MTYRTVMMFKYYTVEPDCTITGNNNYKLMFKSKKCYKDIIAKIIVDGNLPDRKILAEHLKNEVIITISSNRIIVK